MTKTSQQSGPPASPTVGPRVTRRNLLRTAAGLGLVTLAACDPSPDDGKKPGADKAGPAVGRTHKNTEKLPPPIGRAEYEDRIARLQQAMRKHGIDAFFAEPGANLFYLTGVRWGRSERVHGVLILADGPPHYISPAFEVPRLEERIILPGPIHPWEEDESPFARIWQAVPKPQTPRPRRMALAGDTRLFIRSGLAGADPDAAVTDGTAMIAPLRMRKSATELALMQAAFAITFAAMRATAARIETGMTPGDIAALIDTETRRRGARPVFSLVQIGEASAYPHGSTMPQRLHEGDVVLFDCGASVHGYQSDISRTFVHGEPDAQQRRVWEDARRAQEIAFAAAQLGAPCAQVDQAARRFLESRGYGPGYRTPGLPHRTGHGIGIEGHEPPYFVGSDTTPLDIGMCLSIEPGIYLPGRFGVRLEDCLYMTAAGPRWFTEPARSITAPFG